MYCKYCGQEIENDSRFCLNCGKSIATKGNNEIPFENDIIKNNTEPTKNETHETEISFDKNEQEPFFKISKTYYCTNCGSNMGKSKICPTCRLKRKNGINNYCAFCATKVVNEKCSRSNIVVKSNLIEKLLRFVSIFLICFSFLGVFTKITTGEISSALIMGVISLFFSIFVIPPRQIYKLKSLILYKNLKQAWIYLVYVLLIISVLVGIRVAIKKETNLTGNNLAAYNLITEVSYEFKNPSSVRLVSGEVFYDTEDAEWCGWFAISATNGFGARTVGYYFVGYLDGEIFALDLEDNDLDSSIKNAKTKDQLDIDKINNALDKKWGNSFNN